jgi:hypothetical protein
MTIANSCNVTLQLVSFAPFETPDDNELHVSDRARRPPEMLSIDPVYVVETTEHVAKLRRKGRKVSSLHIIVARLLFTGILFPTT